MRPVCLRSEDRWGLLLLKRLWIRLTRGIRVEMRGAGHRLSFGQGGTMSGRVRVFGANNRLSIGDSCFFGETYLDINAQGSEMRIGDRVRVFGNHQLGCTLVLLRGRSKCVTIGNKALLSYRVEIRNSDSHRIHDLETGEVLNRPEDIHIGDHVWICADVMVLKGAMVGSGSIIGCNSVVTGVLGSNLIAGGTPATEKRRGVRWSDEEE